MNSRAIIVASALGLSGATGGLLGAPAALAQPAEVDPATLAAQIVDAIEALADDSSQDVIEAEINRVIVLSGADAETALQALSIALASFEDGSVEAAALRGVAQQIRATTGGPTGAGPSGGDGETPTPPPPGGDGGGGGSDYDNDG